MMSAARRLLSPALIMAAALVAGCDRVLNTLNLTGNVSGAAPQLIGSERLRVSLPETGAVAVLGPVSRSGNVTVWQTLDGITLSFQRGVLIATRGLGDDLMSADVEGALDLLRGRDDGGYYPHIRSYLDGEDRTVFHTISVVGAGRLPRASRPAGRRCVCNAPR